MTELFQAEFVGGPLDGERLLVSHPDRVIVPMSYATPFPIGGKEEPSVDDVQCRRGLYERRQINGVAVRLPNGCYPFDWKGVK